MPDASTVSPAWVDIVAPAAPTTTAGPLLVGAVLMAATILVVAMAIYYRQPRQRARRGLRRLTRQLSRNIIGARKAADEIARQLRRGHRCKNLAALDFGPEGQTIWREFLGSLDRYRFAAAPAPQSELQAAIASALRWLDHNGVAR